MTSRPGITIAGGFQAQYAKGTLTTAIDTGTIGAAFGVPGAIPGAIDSYARVNAHNWAYGFVLGARAVLDDGWTLGASYRSAVHHTLKGPWTFTLDSLGLGAGIRAATGLFTDTTQRAKARHAGCGGVRCAQGFRRAMDRACCKWAGPDGPNFQQLNIVAANPFQPPDVTNAQWNDAWMVSVGAEYKGRRRLDLAGRHRL